MKKFGLGTASIPYKLVNFCQKTVCQFLNATIRSLKNFNIQEARRDAVCGISVKYSKLIIANSILNFLNILFIRFDSVKHFTATDRTWMDGTGMGRHG